MGIFLAIMAGGAANAGPDGKDVPRVAFLGFEFINTSLPITSSPGTNIKTRIVTLLGPSVESLLRGLVSAAPECFLPGPAEPHGGDDQTDH